MSWCCPSVRGVLGLRRLRRMMQLFKPPFVSHSLTKGQTNESIYSVDISPDGERLATAGGDSLAKIWSMECVRSEEVEKKEENQLLATLDRHNLPINVVRFSSQTPYILATGSDDSTIILWYLASLTAPKGKLMTTEERPDQETWSPWCQPLRTHQGDVKDVSWSPDGDMLASCSVDNNVVVWQLGEREARAIRILRYHTGWVTGVAWDPTNRFLASQGFCTEGGKQCGTRVVVWRVGEWEVHEEFSEDFRKSNSDVFFTRLGWSPDGSSLNAPNAHDAAQKNVAIELPVKSLSAARAEEDLENRADGANGKRDQVGELKRPRAEPRKFVGHRQPVVSIRTNPRIFRKKNDTNTKDLFQCFALGSCDGTLSVWVSNQPRPKMVVTQMFDESILDLAWSANGMELVACSKDGSVSFMRMEQKEFGTPLEMSEQANICKVVRTRVVGGARLAESADLLKLAQAGMRTLAPEPTAKNTGAAVSDPQDSQATVSQIEARTSDGRRRITPQVISGGGSGGAVQVFGSSVNKAPAMNANGSALITGPAGVSIKRKTTEAAMPAIPAPSSSAPASSVPMQKKTRIEPVAVQAAAAVPSAMTNAVAGARGDANGAAREVVSAEVLKPAVAKSNHTFVLAPCPTEMGPSLLSDTGLAPMSVPPKVIQVTPGPVDGSSKISCVCEGSAKWGQIIDGQVTCLTGDDENFCAFATHDGAVHVFSSSMGCRVLPALMPGSLISFLAISKPLTRRTGGNFLSTLCTNGNVTVWDIAAEEVVINASSISGILGARGAVDALTVDSCTGAPSILLSNGRLVTWSTKLGAWIRVPGTAASTSVHRFSGFSSALSRPLSDDEALGGATDAHLKQWLEMNGIAQSESASGHLEELLSHTKLSIAALDRQIARAKAAKNADNERERSAPSGATVKDLEAKRNELERQSHLWYLAYAQQLVKHSDAGKLAVVCDQLLGPMHTGNAEVETPKGKRVGANRKFLAQVILPMMSSNPELQRVANRYKDILGTIDGQLLLSDEAPSNAGLLDSLEQ